MARTASNASVNFRSRIKEHRGGYAAQVNVKFKVNLNNPSERGRFELPDRLPDQRFSRPPLSTAQPPLHMTQGNLRSPLGKEILSLGGGQA